MTQQYIVGEFSVLIAALEPGAGELAGAVHALRRKVERVSPQALAPLVVEAVTMADMTCWAALECGDIASFARNTEAAARLHDFAVSAHLLP